MPTTPLLIPELASGAAHDLDELRTAARAAISACEPTGVLLPESPVNSPTWSLPGFGLAIGSGPPVGIAEGVARWLLDGRPAEVVGPGADLSRFSGLLVMGDGSASRTEKAPKHLHPQAVAFDETLLAALRDGDAQALAGLDLERAATVAADGAPAWRALGRAVEVVLHAQVDVAADPYGVLYVVARWSVQWADPA